MPPDQLEAVFSAWAERLQPGGLVLIAFQALSPEARANVEEFDHRVTRAWRWKPDAMAAALTSIGLIERWRVVTQPTQDFHRFPECHLLHALDDS